jgi:hypothetical protein
MKYDFMPTKTGKITKQDTTSCSVENRYFYALLMDGNWHHFIKQFAISEEDERYILFSSHSSLR